MDEHSQLTLMDDTTLTLSLQDTKQDKTHLMADRSREADPLLTDEFILCI